MNNKPEFEDISMGLFHPERHQARKGRIAKNSATQDKTTDPPPLTNLSSDYNILTVEDIDNFRGEL